MDDDDDITPSATQNTRTKERRRFSLQDKMCLVRSIRRRIETENVSIRTACNDANIHHKQYLNWKKSFNAMKDAKNIKAKSNCTGRLSILKPVEQDLLQFIFELREQGMAVSHQIVMIRAALKCLQLYSWFRTNGGGMYIKKPYWCLSTAGA